jgi:hypothetical protein
MVDKVKPLKYEDTTLGSQMDEYPTETDPNEDYITAKGYTFEAKDATRIDTDISDEMQFQDTVVTTPVKLQKIDKAAGVVDATMDFDGVDSLVVGGFDELVENTDIANNDPFSFSTPWTLSVGSTYVWTNGTGLEPLDNGATVIINTDVTITSGRWYLVEMGRNRSAGNLRIATATSGIISGSYNNNGYIRNKYLFQASSTETLQIDGNSFWHSTNATNYIDYFSVKEANLNTNVEIDGSVVIGTTLDAFNQLSPPQSGLFFADDKNMYVLGDWDIKHFAEIDFEVTGSANVLQVAAGRGNIQLGSGSFTSLDFAAGSDITLNSGSGDVDVIINKDDATEAIKVDAGLDKTIINHLVEIFGTGTTGDYAILDLISTALTGGSYLRFWDSLLAKQAEIGYDEPTDAFYINVNAAPLLSIVATALDFTTTGSVTFNSTFQDSDFIINKLTSGEAVRYDTSLDIFNHYSDVEITKSGNTYLQIECGDSNDSEIRLTENAGSNGFYIQYDGGPNELNIIRRNSNVNNRVLEIVRANGDVFFNPDNLNQDFTIRKNSSGDAYVYSADQNTHNFSGRHEVSDSVVTSAIETITASSDTLDDTNYIALCDCSSNSITINLPTAVGNTGLTYVVKKVDATGNIVTIDGNTTETIDGNLTTTITSQYTAITVVSDGANWMII